MQFDHKPVLLEECIEMLNIVPDGVYMDGTLGGAGHSSEILMRLSPHGMLVGIDQDLDAIHASRERLSGIGMNFSLVHTNFANMVQALEGLGIQGVNGILMDLGVSSHQLDEAERGFSYQKDAPLDMRMDQTRSFTAEDLVNNYTQAELERIIRQYGEERWAARIAAFIVKERESAGIHTTAQLSGIIKKAIPAAARREGPHPAKRTFQAIRIAVNDELDILEKAITDAVGLLKPGGRLCIITFHSLEDRIVKTTFARFQNPCICPPGFPICTCGRLPSVRLVGKKPIIPSDRELNENPRARSAKLRVAEKVNNNNLHKT